MKPDYLKECMSEVGNIPLDQFNQAYCLRCGNQECIRSKINNSFESRVKTWEERLFKNPPRAKDDDPRFNNIRSKQFKPIGKHSMEVHTTQQIPVIQLNKPKLEEKLKIEPIPIPTSSPSISIKSEPIPD